MIAVILRTVTATAKIVMMMTIVITIVIVMTTVVVTMTGTDMILMPKELHAKLNVLKRMLDARSLAQERKKDARESAEFKKYNAEELAEDYKLNVKRRNLVLLKKLLLLKLLLSVKTLIFKESALMLKSRHIKNKLLKKMRLNPKKIILNGVWTCLVKMNYRIMKIMKSRRLMLLKLNSMVEEEVASKNAKS